MAYDDEDDLFEEEFDFVDDDDSELEESAEAGEDSKVEQEEPPKPKRRSAKASGPKGGGKRGAKKPAPVEQDVPEKAAESEAEAEPEEVVEPPGPPTDHVVHVYEFGKFKRTVNREFTDEDSIKFAEEYNRTSKSYGRHAVPVQRDEEPEPSL